MMIEMTAPRYNLPLIRERLTAAGIPFESRNESVVRVYLKGETLTAEICWFDYGNDFSFGWAGRMRGIVRFWTWCALRCRSSTWWRRREQVQGLDVRRRYQRRCCDDGTVRRRGMRGKFLPCPLG